MQRQLRVFADRTTRYIRIYQLSEPNSWQTAGDAEHAAILEALIADDEQGALTEMAHHLERTALRVLAEDTDLTLAVGRAGWRIVYEDPLAVVLSLMIVSSRLRRSCFVDRGVPRRRSEHPSMTIEPTTP